MAEQESQNPGATTNTFNKGMVKDYNETFVGEGLYTHARNAVNNSHDGQVGVIGNEPANLYCITLPYTLIGTIHLRDDQWAVFTTDDLNSEIGIFDESTCSYTKIINDPCLNFKRTNLITGVSRLRYDCDRLLYWDDGLNPTRVLNINDIPYVCTDSSVTTTQPFKYKLIGATCPAKTAKTTLIYKDISYVSQTKHLVDGEVFEFLSFDKAADMQITTQSCVEEPCYTHTVSVTIPIAGSTSYELCFTDQQAYEQQFPGGVLDALTVISKKVDNNGNPIPCGCVSQSTTTTPYSLNDVTVASSSSNGIGCTTPVCSDRLDCEKIRLASIVKHPCVSLQKGKGAGTLANGSYQVALAYTVDQVKVTDYFGLSEVQSLFSHQNLSGSLEVTITDIDKNFDEFELIVISNINQQTVAKSLGYYSTSQGVIYISSVGPELITVPLTMVVLRTEPIEKSDALYSVNNYLIRVGTYSKFRFNYQQQANAIRSKWVAVQYPSTYYVKGGNNPSFMRDEQYAFFIRWVYNTGERSDSYHIPGRPAVASDRTAAAGEDVFEVEDGVTPQRWKVENTATVDSLTTSTLADGGKVIASGQMGYWESTEMYPDNKPQIWGALCGQPIRHHKFPDATVDPIINHFNTDGQNIVVLGVQFENITHPLGIDGKPIASVVGYEILRGTREGHKTIVATGVFNNMREYTIQEGTVGVQGLFQNYPYNDLSDDYYLTSNESIINEGSFSNRKKDPLKDYRKDIFSFHSPDTTFTKPFLSVQEVKLYGEVYGKSQGAFEHPWRHPKNKFIGKDVEFVNKALQIIRIINSVSTEIPPGAVEFTGNSKLPVKIDLTPVKPEPKKTVLGSILGGITNLIAPGAGSVVSGIVDNVAYGLNAVGYAAQLLVVKYIHTETTHAQIQILIYGLIPKRQYALQYNSHGFFNKFTQSQTGNRRRKIDDSLYVGGNVQGFDNGFRINNLYRGNFVVIKLPSGKTFADPRNIDDSRVLISDVNTEPRKGFQRNISCHYGAIKIPLPAQYGQLESIKQVPVSTCIGKTNGATGVKFTSDILFGGDVYINKFTEKNTMPFFNDWMIDFPDETAYDYRNYINVPYPRYWMNTAEAEYKLLQSSAKEHHHLDKSVSRFFYIHQGYMYLFNSGVREFFVESEINLAYRDWEDETSKRHYDSSSFTDLSLMFRSDIIRSGNYYKYDYSLSVSKLYSNFISWGNILPRSYDPETYSTCYTYRPRRAIYSLPQQVEISKDNWRVFLANNYKDFSSRISNIKSVNKNGALFMLADQSPIQFMGVDQLQTDAGTKVTIGDGGLFSQPLQNLVNADESYEYGSNQGRYCSVGTTHGVFWISQNQGKVFQYANGLNEISRNGMKWWFAKYLPSELLKAFPDYPLYDNPVSGVGVQMIYDNTHEILYITKKDYKPKFSDLAYDSKGFYRIINGTKTYYTFKSEAFEEASWTISYDPKSKMWISFHDWIPTFLLPGRVHFLSVDSNTVWKHNQRCDKFANFYNKDYPFEVEFISSTGQTVTTVRNIEYLLETYKYHNGCADKFHILDENFDQAIIYNSEQVSGLLEMTLKSKVNPVEMLTYPQVGSSSIKINYSKEENKYRFNQFWDITKNRGEFAASNVPMFNTKANGYQFQINPAYVNYQKPALERKKFRHNVNRVLLRKLTSNDLKMIFKISNQKIQQSLR